VQIEATYLAILSLFPKNRSSQFSQQQSNIELECNICHKGIIKLLETANPIQFMSSSAAPQSAHVDHAKYVKKQQTLPISIAKNKTSSNNAYNNPPLPIPMHNEVTNTSKLPVKSQRFEVISLATIKLEQMSPYDSRVLQVLGESRDPVKVNVNTILWVLFLVVVAINAESD
jgi:hypothetical protein